MEPGIAEILGPRAPEPKIIRVLWRMQGPTRVIVARIERHPFGRELIIAFEDGDDVIETRLERVNVAMLEQRTDGVRQVLVTKGWNPISLFLSHGTNISVSRRIRENHESAV